MYSMNVNGIKWNLPRINLNFKDRVETHFKRVYFIKRLRFLEGSYLRLTLEQPYVITSIHMPIRAYKQNHNNILIYQPICLQKFSKHLLKFRSSLEVDCLFYLFALYLYLLIFLELCSIGRVPSLF